MQIRRMREGEADALGQIMFEAVAVATLYTPAQRRAWLPDPPQGKDWAAQLEGQRVWVAEEDGPVGFATLVDEAYVDLVFVRPAAQGRGVFSALMDALEASTPANRLWTHASLHAQPAFAARGFRVVRHEEVERGAETLPRAEMEKLR